MKYLKKISCLALALLMPVLMMACGAANDAPQNLVDKPVVSGTGPNANGEIVLGEQSFSVNAEQLTLNLQIRSNEVLDLSPLEWCTQLRRLSIHLTIVPHIYYDESHDPHLAEQTPVDLKPLATLANLEHLELNVGKIENLMPLAYLQKLSTLVLWIDGETDLTPLAACAALSDLMLGGRGTVDLAPISKFPVLTGLRVDVYDSDWNTPDLSALSGAPCLETLSTGASRGLSELRDVPLKKLVDLNDSGDILENLPNLDTLEYLEFSDEHLSDIRPLLQHAFVITQIVLEVGAQDIDSFSVISSADDPMLDALITSIPVSQLREYLAVKGTSLTIVVDKNRTAGAVE